MGEIIAYKKPKNWTNYQWIGLIYLLREHYRVTAGQIGPEEYELDVEISTELHKSIKRVCRE